METVVKRSPIRRAHSRSGIGKPKIAAGEQTGRPT